MKIKNFKKISFTDKEPKTLFLDRDGVINVSPKELYVKSWEEFKFEYGVLGALKIFNNYFDYIIVVTNQRGVGKNLMTVESLIDIHINMCFEVLAHGGRIDQVYYCTDLDYNSVNLKPNSGMAYKAKLDYKDISFKNSLMIGDSLSDIEFGKRLDMKTILICNDEPQCSNPNEIFDVYCKNLLEVVNHLDLSDK